MKSFITFLLLLLFFACAGKPTPIPNIDSAQAKLYAGKCGTCHSLPHPKRHTASQWELSLAIMDIQMEHEKMTPLTEDERNTILGYLTKNAR